MTLPESLVELHNLIHGIPASNAGSFEDLVADALAHITGQTFRLAKSGSQFGRDASTSNAPFAIAMEAKKYHEKIPLDDVAGKALIGGYALQGKVDLWILASTGEVGDNTERILRQILTQFSVELLTLDWAQRPLPALATLFAAAEAQVKVWFQTHIPLTDQRKLAEALSAVKESASFASQKVQLLEKLSAAEVGLGTLRETNAAWLRKHLLAPASSAKAFGQHIVITDTAKPPVRREASLKALDAALLAGPSNVAVLLGDEGVGKTWLAAQWWAEQRDPPVTLLVAGRCATTLDPASPLESLATLIATQLGRGGESTETWVRRLQRWNKTVTAKLRFLLILDGLNEQQSLPWADIIKNFAPIIQELGGHLLVTCRPGYWDRDVYVRLRDSIQTTIVNVPGYTDGELAAILIAAGLKLEEIPAQLKEFIRNPRICSVAVKLMALDRLHVDELTTERLLLAYWANRLVERGDLIKHNQADLDKLLRSHARAWLDAPKQPFDVDNWADHSGRAKRGFEDIKSDLTEIEEGRFLKTDPKEPHLYSFRAEALPYALGLLLLDEIRRAYRHTGDIDDDMVQRIIDPVRGFDPLASVLAAAVGLACLNENFPRKGRIVLIRAFFSLQNVDWQHFKTLVAYVPGQPDVFLDVAQSERGHEIRPNGLVALLRLATKHPKAEKAFQTRFSRWLGRWSRQTRMHFGNGNAEQRQLKRGRE